MIRVLIADNDLDSHKLIVDLVEMIFRDVTIDRALSKESLLVRVGAPEADYHLILFNLSLDNNESSEILNYIRTYNSRLIERIVFIASKNNKDEIPDELPVLIRPFSLDDFSEVVKKVCAATKY